MTHRNWFSFIFIGLSAALLAFIAVVYTPSTTDVPSDDTGGVTAPRQETRDDTVAPTASEYESAARSVLAAYEAGGDASAAYSVLIALRVPAEYQSAHLALVIAFAQLQAGNAAEGASRLADAKTAYAWLTE